MYVTIVR